MTQPHSVQKILTYFPRLQDELMEQIDTSVTTKKYNLDEHETVFLQMCRFFLDPSSQSFDVALIYRQLDGDWISFAIECLNTFFQEDTYLLPNQNILFIREEDPLLNQTSFAKELTEHGKTYDVRKINVYRSRGLLPKPDALIENKPFWYKSTALKFIQNDAK